MAEKIVIEIDLEKGDVTGATKALESSASKTGKKAASNFKKNFNKGIANSFKNLGKSALKASSIVGGLATALTGIQSIRAAQVQEDAINALNSSLLLSKNASIEASQGIQEYASSIQKSTRFGDEQLIQNAALIQSLGDLDEKGLKRALSATTDLATALRVDLGTAATLVGKAAAGEVGSFSRYGLSIKKASDNTKTFANALDAIEGKFGGAAANDVGTFSGAIDQLSNAFGDVLEEIGQIVTQNPAFTKVIKQTTALLTGIGESVNTFGKDNDVFSLVTNSAIKLGQTLIDKVAKPIEFLSNIFTLSKNIIASGINTIIAGFAKMGSFIAKILDGLGIETKLSREIQRFSDTASQAAVIGAEKTKMAFDNLFNFSVSEKLQVQKDAVAQFFDEVAATTEEKTAIQKEKNTEAISVAAEQAASLSTIYDNIFNKASLGLEGVGSSLADVNKQMKSFAAASGKALVNGFASSAGTAFAEFGKAAANGENALEAFGKSLIKSIGQQAITLGTKFILEGTAYLFSPGFQGLGAPLIAAGAGLAAFGGVLGAVSGGGASGGSSGGGGGAGGGAIGAPQETLADPTAQVATATESTRLNLNIEGSLIRESELSGFVSELLETSSSRDDNIIPSLRTGLA